MNDKPEIKPQVVSSLKHICMTIGELPTSYLESMTYYEMLVWFTKFLQEKMIPALDNNALAVQELQELFIELQSYVNDYFDNLDVQEEINNKLDEMVEDGTLASLINEYISGLGINVKTMGAKGDDLTDDTEAIQTAITYCKNNNINKLFFPTGTYKITDGFTIDFSGLTIEGVSDVTLKYYGNGYTGKLFNIVGTNADNYIENISIKNITIDGTNQLYKGGYSELNPNVTSPNPKYKGLNCFFAQYVKNITIDNCIINDLYGDGMIIKYSNPVCITNNKLYDVGAGNIVIDGQTGYDNHGDGISCYFCYNCNVENNTVINTRVYQEDRVITSLNKLCGRSGLEFEYIPNADASSDAPDNPLYNCPDYNKIPLNTSSIPENKREGSALRFINNVVQGYTKGIHIESHVKTIITNNSLCGNYINILYTTNAEQVCSNNYINTWDVGTCPQSGYDEYCGCIAITEYATSAPMQGMIINGNSLNGTGKGIVLGRRSVTINGNRINNDKSIYTKIENLEDINITGNVITNNLETQSEIMFIYSSKNVNISNNLLQCAYPKYLRIQGNKMNISNNIFDNVTLNGISNPQYINITNNTFKISVDLTNNRKAIIYGDNWKNLSLKNNIFDLSSITGSRVLYIDGTTNYNNIDSNTTILNSSNTLNNIMFFGTFKYGVISNNKVYNIKDNKAYIYCYNFIDSKLIRNSLDNTNSYIFKTDYSGGPCVASENEGYMTYGEMNQSLNKFANYYINMGTILVRYGLTTASTKYGWVCVQSGIYTTKEWTTSTAYTSGNYVVNSNGNVYKCITGGTSTVEPTGTNYDSFTLEDNLVWQYYGKVAKFIELNI